MTRLQIKIKDAEKAVIVLNLLKELPFVEIEKSEEEDSLSKINRIRGSLKGKGFTTSRYFEMKKL